MFTMRWIAWSNPRRLSWQRGNRDTGLLKQFSRRILVVSTLTNKKEKNQEYLLNTHTIAEHYTVYKSGIMLFLKN
jgi:hypothetical protein